MSVPPDQLQQLMASKGPNPSAGAAPMSAPQEASGQKLAGMPKVKVAMKMLTAALADFDPKSDEGAIVYRTLIRLQKKFGKEEGDDLVPAELAMLQGGSEAPPQVAAMQQAAAQRPPQMPAGMPPGMPM